MPSHPCMWLLHCCYVLLSPRVMVHISNVFVVGAERMKNLEDGVLDSLASSSDTS